MNTTCFQKLNQFKNSIGKNSAIPLLTHPPRVMKTKILPNELYTRITIKQYLSTLDFEDVTYNQLLVYAHIFNIRREAVRECTLEHFLI